MGRFKTDKYNTDFCDKLCCEYGYIKNIENNCSRRYELKNDKYAIVKLCFSYNPVIICDVEIFKKDKKNSILDKMIDCEQFELTYKLMKDFNVFIDKLDNLLEPYIGDEM